jgi:hypothetical protein
MLPMIALLAAAATTAPVCPVPAAPANAVMISSAVMPVEAVGGAYVLGNGWPPPGEARVGLVRYEWGLLLRSDDARFADFDLSPGPIHSRTSGCWFAWDSHWGKHGIDAISNARIGESGYRAGYVPDRPTSTPTIAGYRLVAADKAYSPDYAWVGLWVPQDGVERTQVVAFDDRHHKLLATLPFRLGGLSTLPGPDNPALGITMIGEGKSGQPVPYLQLLWMSGLHETDAR